MANADKMTWAGRVLTVLAVLPLIASAAMKFSGKPEVLEGMAHLGISEGTLATLGIIEIVCTLLYVIPQTAVLGAILLTGYLGGATLAHLRVGDSPLTPVILGVVAWGGLFLRDARVRALLPFRRT